MKILSIVNRKGGASKSTLAAHLALEATDEGLKRHRQVNLALE